MQLTVYKDISQNIHKEVEESSDCGRKTSHTALDCYSNNPEHLLCSALCLRAVLISRMYALALMHRRTLCENVDSAKINVPFYTTDIDILRVASMHRIVIHRIDISIHIDEHYTPTTGAVLIIRHHDKPLRRWSARKHSPFLTSLTM